MPYAIEINNLYKQYKGALTPAVNGLSLKVEKNQVVGLLGPNGAGKTTSINIMCGLIMPDEGNVQLLGKDAIKETQEVRSMIGVVP
ncbi:MAG: ATP-binding cassette domain-containing protein, partial [Bacteroidetes bacterium]|nr:ATP-binding cassette domain-containing protein [Bacteroidota bacterium]